MAAKDEPEYVTENTRRKLPRPQPPMKDRRAKRNRTRSEQERRQIREQGE